MRPEELKQYEDMANDYRYDGSVFKPVVVKLLAEVRNLEAECEMLAEIMPDCPVKYGASVWCMRRCPVWERHDINGPDYYCTTAERREYARKEVERYEKDRVRREQAGGVETKDTPVGT